MDDLNTLWSKLLSDYARIKNKATKLSGGYQAFIDAAAALIRQCYGALSSLTDNEYTVDGGTPFTQIDVITELVTESGPIVSFDTKLHSSRPIEALIVDIDPIQSGTGEPSPTNIRPISGFNSVKVTRAGKNLFSTFEEGNTTSAGITFDFSDSDVVKISGTSTGNNASSSNKIIGGSNAPTPIVFKQGHTYTISLQGIVSLSKQNDFRLFLRTNNNSNLWYGDSDGVWTFTPEETFVAERIMLRIKSSNTTVNVDAHFQIEFGSVPTTYEAYKGDTYDVSLSSSGTVYGGILDVVSGELVVNHVFHEFDGNEAIGNIAAVGTYARTRYTLSNIGGSGVMDGLTNFSHGIIDTEWAGEFGHAYGTRSYAYLFLPCGATASSAQAYLAGQKTAGTPVQIVWILATPITYQLTAQEVKTLLGNNNIWADAGDVTVTYPAKSDKDCNGGYPGS